MHTHIFLFFIFYYFFYFLIYFYNFLGLGPAQPTWAGLSPARPLAQASGPTGLVARERRRGDRPPNKK